jgi:hypothetical protein
MVSTFFSELEKSIVRRSDLLIFKVKNTNGIFDNGGIKGSSK